MKRLRVTVLLGGPSAEREVSLRSGAAVARALRAAGHAVTEVDPRDGVLRLDARPEVVFLALHGSYGEDGTVQAELDRAAIPYTGCGAEVSRIAFDKQATKERLRKVGVPTPRSLVLASAPARWPEGWNPPVVLKPVRQGSSVGLRFVGAVEDFPGALEEALRHDDRVLMEERILGRETTVGLLGGTILPVVEIRPRAGAYDYANKYTPGRTEYFCPADFAPEVTRRITRAAAEALAAIGGGDYARVDVMVDAAGNPFVLEVNTLPGMTETSLFPKAAAAAGLSFTELCERLLDLALARAEGRERPSSRPEPLLT